MGVELICLSEAFNLVRRDNKYFSVVGQMYLAGLRNPIKSRVFRAAYFFCRHIDDVLDGDIQISSEPKDYVSSILDGMDGKNPSPKIVSLYKFVIDRIKTDGDDNPKRDFKKVIDAMLFDYERSRSRRFLSREQLDDYFTRTFVPVLNISLQIGESKLRGNNLPEMVLIMGHLYSVRDLQTDLSRGIINIPQEELETVVINGSLSYERVCSNIHLSSWIDSEIEKYSCALEQFKNKIREEGDNSSRRICMPLIRSMERYCEKHFQRRA